MKRKISIILILTMVVSTVLTGCTNPLDKFKKGEEEAPTEIVEENSNVTLTGTGTYFVGDIVTIDDVISIDESVAGNVTNKVFLSDTGSLLEQLDTAVAGEFTVNIVVEFSDVEGWQTQYTYIVEEPESKLPDNVKANFDNATDICTYGSLSIVNKDGWEYQKDIVTTTINGVEIKPGIYYYDTANKSDIGHAYIREYSSMEEANSVLQSELVEVFAWTLSSTTSAESIEDFENSDVEVDTESNTMWSDFLSTVIVEEETSITGSTLYDVNGTVYSSNVTAVYLDLSFMKEEYNKVLYAYKQYFNVDGKIYEITYYGDKEDVEDTLDESDITQVDITAGVVAEGGLKEQFTKVYTANPLMSDIAYKTLVMNPLSNLDVLSDVVIIGTYGKEAVVEETTNNKVEVKAGTKEETVSGMVGNVKPTYQSKHPELYTWPESDTKYRKWVYVIGEGVTYTGSIILPDGTVLSTENGDTINSSNGSTSNGGGTQANNSVVVSLMSSYGTYFVSNKDKQEAIIDTANSSSSVAVVSYNNNKYYIETARAATITNYQQNCIYSTAGMKDGSYSVESVDNKAVTTEIGKIIPYTISYTDYNYKKQEKGYMAVYNISNDYLVIYADNPDADTSTMIELLSKLISK